MFGKGQQYPYLINMNILVTLDSNYVKPLLVMLKSLFMNNAGETFTVYLIYSHITDAEIKKIEQFCSSHDSVLVPVFVPDQMFADAPVFRHYTKAMFYRLLACELLPDTLDKVLYLDPDILVINPVRPLYDTELGEYLFAGASHSSISPIPEQINRVRLKTNESAGYFNSGVLLMNLNLQRKYIRKDDIFNYVREHKNELILPDQDVLNALYGSKIMALDDSIYNYDARNYNIYYLLSNGKKGSDWVMENTVFLHFCGSSKPWQKNYYHRFGMLYKHYLWLAARSV